MRSECGRYPGCGNEGVTCPYCMEEAGLGEQLDLDQTETERADQNIGPDEPSEPWLRLRFNLTGGDWVAVNIPVAQLRDVQDSVSSGGLLVFDKCLINGRHVTHITIEGAGRGAREDLRLPVR